MSEKYSAEFKAKVALKAVSKDPSEYQKVAEEFDVTVEEVTEWASELIEKEAKVFKDDDTKDEGSVEDVELTTEDEEFALAVDHGAMGDPLNYKKLTGWAIIGAILIIVFIIGMVNFSQYSLFESQKKASIQSTRSEVNDLKNQQNEELNSFGVVDLEQGIYRIPIEEAINRIATN